MAKDTYLTNPPFHRERTKSYTKEFLTNLLAFYEEITYFLRKQRLFTVLYLHPCYLSPPTYHFIHFVTRKYKSTRTTALYSVHIQLKYNQQSAF